MGKFEEKEKPSGLRVRNWRDFQHYRDRNPPWIKLHFSLLSSVDWVMLDDASRVLAIACMLVASRNNGLIPENPSYLQRVAYLKQEPNFNPLIDCGFLEYASECKQMIASARPEESREEVEKEKRQRRDASAYPVDNFRAKENGAWWKSEPGIEAKGKELGLPPNRGESWNDYKDRLFAVINLQKA